MEPPRSRSPCPLRPLSPRPVSHCASPMLDSRDDTRTPKRGPGSHHMGGTLHGSNSGSNYILDEAGVSKPSFESGSALLSCFDNYRYRYNLKVKTLAPGAAAELLRNSKNRQHICCVFHHWNFNMILYWENSSTVPLQVRGPQNEAECTLELEHYWLQQNSVKKKKRQKAMTLGIPSKWDEAKSGRI